MQTKLDRLLESIDPERTLEENDRRVDEALNGFQSPAAVITNWDRFRDCLIRFLCHVESTVLKIPPPKQVDIDFEWGRCFRILQKDYGPNGEKAAFETARTGNEGGLYRVLKTFARRMAYEYSENEINAKVLFYWKTLSVEEQLEAPSEYLRKYGHLLPPELTEGSAARVKVEFPEVLKKHPQLVRRLRKVGRNGESHHRLKEKGERK